MVFETFRTVNCFYWKMLWMIAGRSLCFLNVFLCDFLLRGPLVLWAHQLKVRTDVCSLNHSFVRSFSYVLFIHLPIHSFIHSFTLLISDIFIQSFIHPFDLNSQFSLSFARSLGSTIGSFVRILICWWTRPDSCRSKWLTNYIRNVCYLHFNPIFIIGPEVLQKM